MSSGPITPEFSGANVPDEAAEQPAPALVSQAQGFDPAASGAPESPTFDPTGAPGPVTPRVRSGKGLGYFALGLSVLFLIADIVAIALAAAQVWGPATAITQVTTVVTGVSFGLGLITLFISGRKARWLGISALVVSVVANPLVLLNFFKLFGSA